MIKLDGTLKKSHFCSRGIIKDTVYCAERQKKKKSASLTFWGWNSGSMTQVAPTQSGHSSLLTTPWTWWRGKVCRMTSSLDHAHSETRHWTWGVGRSGLLRWHIVFTINYLSQLSLLQTFVTMISPKLSFGALPDGKIDFCNLFEFFPIVTVRYTRGDQQQRGSNERFYPQHTCCC